jgi:hypothetical protein
MKIKFSVKIFQEMSEQHDKYTWRIAIGIILNFWLDKYDLTLDTNGKLESDLNRLSINW